jgi:glucose/arabinose dehydrogenase
MKKLVLFSALIFFFGRVIAQPQIQLENFVTGLTLPLGIFNAGDERLFVVEKAGRIKVIMPNGTVNSTPFLDISSIVKSVNNSSSELGLLGLAFHPNYKTNGYFYVNYTRKANTSSDTTIVARYTVSAGDSNVANPNSEQILMIIPQPFSNHNGGCIHFGKDGYLYIGMGDGGSSGDPQNHGQTATSLLGKMLRIDVNTATGYNIPATNPFFGSGSVRNEIWASGLRNPWRFSFDRITADMWMGDVGQNAWEEINFQPFDSDGGENYGWKCFEGTASFSSCPGVTGLTDPIYVYDHSSAGGFSVTGGHVYRSAKYKGAWGYYLFADAVSQHMWASINDNGNFTTTKVLNGTAGASNVSFGEDVYGNMYLVKHSGGTIQKIKETGTAQPKAYILNKFINTICEGTPLELQALFHPDLTYQWRKDGQDIPNAFSATYNATEAGDYDVIVRDTVNIAALPDTSTSISLSVISASISALMINNYTVDITDNPFGILTTIGGGTFSGIGVDASGLFTPSVAGEGTFEIVYTITSNGCPQRDTATVIVTDLVSVKNITLQPEIKIFPNPAKDNLTIQSTMLIKGITVYDMLGKIVLHENVNAFTQNIGLNNMQQGMYFVKVESATTSAIQKVIIE